MLESCRRIDLLGRVTIPRELRKKHGISDRALLCIREVDQRIVIEKVSAACRLCRSEEDVDEEIRVCNACKEKIKSR